MRILLAVLLAVVSFPLAAFDVTFPIGSYHFDRSRNFNEENFGVGFEYESWTGGYYLNSYRKDTFYAGYAWRPLQWKGWLRAGFVTLAATGYDSPILVVPTIAIEGKWAAADFMLAPTLGKASGFIGLQLRLPIRPD